MAQGGGARGEWVSAAHSLFDELVGAPGLHPCRPAPALLPLAHQPLAVVEGDADVPLLPLDEVAVHLQGGAGMRSMAAQRAGGRHAQCTAAHTRSHARTLTVHDAPSGCTTSSGLRSVRSGFSTLRASEQKHAGNLIVSGACRELRARAGRDVCSHSRALPRTRSQLAVVVDVERGELGGGVAIGLVHVDHLFEVQVHHRHKVQRVGVGVVVG